MGSMTDLETVDERNKKGEMLILCLMFLSMVAAVDKIGGEAAECACGHSDRARDRRGTTTTPSGKERPSGRPAPAAFNYEKGIISYDSFRSSFGSLRP